MRRIDLQHAVGGLGLVVAGRELPGLRLEVTSGRRLLLRQLGWPVLLGRVEPDNCGVDVYRTGEYRSPLPPLRADQARQVAQPGSVAWLNRWSHRFASWLGDADAGPLHHGFWTLRPRQLPPYCLRGDLVSDYPAAYLDWFGQGWNGVLPLRRLPEVDAARVTSYRRQAREEVLPPILLWSVSCFDGYLLVDGHCRLVAALAEGVEPPVLVLAANSTFDVDRQWFDQVGPHLELAARLRERAAQGDEGALVGAEAITRRFAEICADLPDVSRTRAWPVPGGVRAWEELAVRVAPGWPADTVD